MDLSLRDITRENWYQCTQLQISEKQRTILDFPVVYWMAECRYRPGFHELAVYWHDDIVGFLVWGRDPDDDEYWIVFLMIDHVHQNRGYGTMALKELVSLLSSKPGCERIWIGHNPQNTAAAHIYSKSGFQDTGRREGGEIIRCLTISRDE